MPTAPSRSARRHEYGHLRRVSLMEGPVMAPAPTPPLQPFVDRLPVPERRLARDHQGRLTVRIRAAKHRFHRDLPESQVWTYDGLLPGPTIEAEHGQAVRVEWRNELDGTLPVTVATAPRET